ncbi:WhiB family transcriptional regulator [Nonomuraea sp. NPDC050786]|uniref:WhiB family transcriptional regulator n=1 Tax=Nonomuraea sp. NPDC050786 TaxID=3154840 RepID=UPI0033D1F5F6
MSTIIAPVAAAPKPKPAATLQQRLKAEQIRLAEATRLRGKCVRQNTEQWFPDNWRDADAEKACRGCWVQAACFRLHVIDEALIVANTGSSVSTAVRGVAGGLTPSKRRRYVKALADKLRAEASA